MKIGTLEFETKPVNAVSDSLDQKIDQKILREIARIYTRTTLDRLIDH